MGELDIGRPLDGRVHEAVDDAQCVEVEVVSMLSGDGAVGNLLILLLEEAHEAGAVVAAVALGPQADAVVFGLMVRELVEPDLGKVPQGVGGLGGAVGRLRRLLAADCANEVRQV